ncbi:MAG: glycosyltransferase [Planctomycetota bacterium]
MRILHVLAEVGWSGGEEQLAHLVRHLRVRGHENHFALVDGSRFAERMRADGFPVHSVNLRRPIRDGGYLALKRTVRATQPELVHFGCGRSMTWGGFALRADRRPVKVTTRRIDYPIARGPWGGGRYRRFVDHVIANCRAVERRLLSAGMPRDRVSLIHEGIDPAPLEGIAVCREEARVRLGIPRSATVVSCAATLRPRKGQRVLIEAIGALRSQHPQVMLVLAGDGPDANELRDLSRARGLGEVVRLAGEIHPIADLYAATDVFAMSSWHEGLSNACLEAAAAGLPLVVTDVGGLPEIVDHGRTGFVVPPGDHRALADRLGTLLADEALRRSAGAAGRARVTSQFTVQRMAEASEQLFLRLLASRHPTSKSVLGA